jgi:hypothetical protein
MMITLEEIFGSIDRYAKVNEWKHIVPGHEPKSIKPGYVLFLSALNDIGKPMPKSTFLEGKPSDQDIDKLISLCYITETTQGNKSYIEVSEKMKEAKYFHS